MITAEQKPDGPALANDPPKEPPPPKGPPRTDPPPDNRPPNKPPRRGNALIADVERMLAEPFELLVAATADCDDPQLRNELGDVARLLYLARHVLSRIELPARRDLVHVAGAIPVATTGGLGPNSPTRLVADSRPGGRGSNPQPGANGLGSNPSPARGGTCAPALGMGREGDMVTALAAGSGQAPPCLAADAGGNASNASAPGVGFTLPRPPEFSIGSALIGGAR